MSAGTVDLIVETAAVEVDPGVELATEIIRPADTRQCPTLLTRTPYGIPHSRLADDVVGMAHAGWAVVVQDVRGRGDSDGTFEPFVDEARDAASALDWIVDQPWSDGRVAMFGGSYRGATAHLAARTRHSALRAIAPYVATATFDEGWTFEGGIPTRGFLRNWALRFASTDPRRSPDQRQRAIDLAARAVAPTEMRADDAATESIFPTYRAWVNRDDAYWQRVDPEPDPGPDDIAGFHVAGWYDMFCEGSLAAFIAACRSSTAPQHLVVGPWSHALAPGSVVGDLDLGPAADCATFGLDERRDRFLHAALDRSTDLEPRRVDVFQLGSKRWLRLPQWPPESTSWTLPLGADGKLGSPDGGIRDETLEHDPTNPAVSVGGRQPSHWPRPGPIALLTGRADTARFVSPPLGTNVDVIGVVRAILSLQTSGLASLVVRLVDVGPDGLAYTIVEHGHRLGPLPTNVEIELKVGSTAWMATTGHRIGLELAPAAWPRLAPISEPFKVTIQIGGSSRLELPVATPPA